MDKEDPNSVSGGPGPSIPISAIVNQGSGAVGNVVAPSAVDYAGFDKQSSFLAQQDNRYSESSLPPFVVYLIDTDLAANVGDLHPIIVGSELHKAKIASIKCITSSGPEKNAIMFESGKLANEFVDVGIKSLKYSWKAIIPNASVFKVGVVRKLPLDFSEDLFWQGLDAESRNLIDRVEFMKKRTNSVVNGEKRVRFDNIGTIKVFARDNLPTVIHLFGTPKDVDKFILKAKRCFRCQRYGHVNTNCGHNIRCLRCGEYHKSEGCNNNIKCANCGGRHLASDEICIVYNYNLEILEMKSKLESSFKDAAILVSEKFREEFNIIIEEDLIVRSEADENRYLESKNLKSGAVPAQSINPQPSSVQSVTELNRRIDVDQRKMLKIKLCQEYFETLRLKLAGYFDGNSDLLEVFDTVQASMVNEILSEDSNPNQSDSSS